MRLLELAKGQAAGDGTAISDCLFGLALSKNLCSQHPRQVPFDSSAPFLGLFVFSQVLATLPFFSFLHFVPVFDRLLRLSWMQLVPSAAGCFRQPPASKAQAWDPSQQDVIDQSPQGTGA